MNKQELTQKVNEFLKDERNLTAIAGMSTAVALATGNFLVIAAVLGIDYALYSELK